MGHTLIDTKPHDPIVSHRGRGSSRRRLYTAHECSEPAHTAAVSFWAVAHLLAREQLPASATPLSQVRLLLAPQRKRSSAPDPVCEANTEDTVRYGRHAFLACLPYSQVYPKCARTKCTGEHWRACGKARGIGASSSWYGGRCSKLLRSPTASSTFVLLATHAHRSACVELEVNQ
jgi:hypothetical protein